MATSVDYSAADHESPSCYNFWSLFGCEDEKLKQLRIARRRDMLPPWRGLQSLNAEQFYEANESPREFKESKPWNAGLCCRRKARGAALLEEPRSQKEPWIWAPQADENEIDLEWKIVEHELDYESLCRLRAFREVVAQAGLDFHVACRKAPHSKRPGTLLRFLRARNWNQELSLKLLQEALDWRRDYQLEEKLEAWRAEWQAQQSRRVQLWRKYGYIKQIGLDHDGLPIHLHRLSQCDAGGLAREAGDEAFLLYHLMILEDCFEAAQERMLKSGKLITNFVDVYDQGDYGLVDGYLRRGYKAWEPYKMMIPILDKVYPERVRVAFILRCPAVFAIFWRLVEPFVPPATVKKIRIKGYSAKSYVGEMKEFMVESVIPPFLGSDDRALLTTAEPWGGWVPNGGTCGAWLGSWGWRSMG
ncbi:unnamed protein product [Durusdinium trenchii]|uniref:CRAL-TRIO domain-containing protein n=3 Tax=Durusdinium trenchii TaxID=1381693 RepID=A0ABP0NMG8_9DINO